MGWSSREELSFFFSNRKETEPLDAQESGIAEGAYLLVQSIQLPSSIWKTEQTQSRTCMHERNLRDMVQLTDYYLIPVIFYAVGTIANVIYRHRLLNERQGYEAGRKVIPLTEDRRYQINFNYWVYFIFMTICFMLIR